MSSHNNQIETLNTLITTLYDGENGYKEAAEEVSSVTLATRFRQLAQQRYDFGHEIKPFIKGLGGEPNKGGSATASIHRVWMDLKAAVANNDEKVILKECIRGEESAVESYEAALEGTTLIGAARETVITQLEKINRTLAELRIMVDSYETA
jgi:uncharacterized protein (TIGR02284 family)